MLTFSKHEFFIGNIQNYWANIVSRVHAAATMTIIISIITINVKLYKLACAF